MTDNTQSFQSVVNTTSPIVGVVPVGGPNGSYVVVATKTNLYVIGVNDDNSYEVRPIQLKLGNPV